MPKTARGGRNVFGDVSNNRRARRHTAVATKKSATARGSNGEPNETEIDAQPRRSSRLSSGDQPVDDAVDSESKTTTTTTTTTRTSRRSSRLAGDEPVAAVAQPIAKPAAAKQKKARTKRALRLSVGDESIESTITGYDHGKQSDDWPPRSSRLSISETNETADASDTNAKPGASRVSTTSSTQPTDKTTEQLRRSSRLSLGEQSTSGDPADDSKRTRSATSRGRPARSRNINKSDEPAKKAKQSTRRGDPSGDDTKGKTKSSKRSRQADKSEERPKKAARKRAVSTTSRAKPAKVEPIVMSEPCCDFLPVTDWSMVRSEAFDSSKFTFGIAPHDMVNKDDVNQVAEYVTDMFQRQFDSEERTHPSPYIHKQPKLNSTMRAILIDWLVEVHMKFKLAPETLYLAVNITDRYLNLVNIERNRLQLVGVTALLLACKYEEIYPPEVRDCVYICDRAYTRQDVLDMEEAITKALSFRLSVATGHHFLQRFIFLAKATNLQTIAANYYMERMLQEYSLLKYKPSLIAAAAVSLAINHDEIREKEAIRTAKPGVPQALLDYTKYPRASILEVAEKIESKVANNVITLSRRELEAVKRKYNTIKYVHISIKFDPPQASDIAP